MKTSNQLLIGLFVVIFIAIGATAMVLKTEFDKIDKDDPFYGYTLENPPPFRAVKLTGDYQQLVQLQPSREYAIRMNKYAKNGATWKVSGDTLTVSFDFPTQPKPNFHYAFYDRSASLYITLPYLASLTTQGITTKLTGWQQDSLQLTVRGIQQGSMLTGNRIDQLSATATHNGLILLESDNAIAHARVSVQDSSALTARYSAIDSLSLRIDSTASVELPGALLRTVTSQ